jgi:two-component system chemotaxis response regulator CheY
MKEYGFSLDAIRELLISNNQTRIEIALKNRSQELNIEHAKIFRTIQHIHRRLNKLNGAGENMKIHTVLIIDDAAFMRHILCDILGKHGYTVLGEASTGEEGIAKFNQLRPDIVIMDIHMPEGLDGIQATKKIKEISKDARVLICSARGQLDNILNSLHSGAQAFVVKPFQAEYLLDSMSELLEDKYNYNIELVSKWLADDTLTSKFPNEPLVQGGINKLLKICSLSDPNSDEHMMELITEI